MPTAGPTASMLKLGLLFHQGCVAAAEMGSACS